MDPFPSSVSVVSEIDASSTTSHQEFCVVSFETFSTIQESYNPPSIWKAVQTVAPEFYPCFPEFRPGTPFYQFSEKENVYRVSIPFTSRIHQGILVYTLSQSSLQRWKATFEPFLSSDGIDWVTLYYGKFEPGFYRLERVLEEVFTEEYLEV